MSDLHLTDEEVKELPGMGLLGEEAAYELGLWRHCTIGKWQHRTADYGPYDDVRQREIIESDQQCDCPVTLFERHAGTEKDGETVAYLQNTAELRAALVYWTLKEDSVRATMKNLHTEFDKFGPRTEISQIRKTVEAIVQALKELRRDHP